MTKEECLDNMKCVEAKLREHVYGDSGHPRWRTFRQVVRAFTTGTRFLYSLDHAPNNVTPADLLDRMNSDPTDVAPLPRYSPDAHKVVEHFINRLEACFYQACARSTDVHTPADLQRVLRTTFYAMPAEPIEKDVASLPLTYRAISTPAGKAFTVEGKRYFGSGGGWPAQGLR